jgi:hypothetical protein
MSPSPAPAPSPAKACSNCGVDVSRAQRFKDRQGRYLCAPCESAARAAVTPSPAPAAPADDQPVDFGLIDLEPVAPSAPATSPCPECGRPVGVNARLCVACGYDKSTGRIAQATADPPGLTRKERGAGKGKPGAMSCVQCGYSLKGLKSPKCPECGTVNSLARRNQAGDAATLRSMYVRPLLGAFIGATAYALMFLAHSGEPLTAAFALVYLGVATVIGFITYVVCSMMFIGFDEPLTVTFCRIACVWAVYNASATLINMIPLGGLLLWPLKALIFIGLLIWIMEIEIEDAWGVAVACLLVNVGLTIVFVGLMTA